MRFRNLHPCPGTSDAFKSRELNNRSIYDDKFNVETNRLNSTQYPPNDERREGMLAFRGTREKRNWTADRLPIFIT